MMMILHCCYQGSQIVLLTIFQTEKYNFLINLGRQIYQHHIEAFIDIMKALSILNNLAKETSG